MNSLNPNIVQAKDNSSKLKGELFLEQYHGKPIDEIGIVSETEPEVDWGKPVGEEIW